MRQYQKKYLGSASGFTLLELMIAVVMLSILTTLAIPSYKTMIANNRGSTHANALIQVLTAARAEAIKLNRNVVVCKSNNSTTPACTDSLTWDQGVVTFADADGNGTINTGETILRLDIPFVRESVITAPSTIDRISYSPSGLGTSGGSFRIRPRGTTGVNDKTVTLSTVGRPRIGS